MQPHHKVISITAKNISFLQAKDASNAVVKQVPIQGKTSAEIIKILSSIKKEFKLANGPVIAVFDRQNVLIRYLTLPSSDPIEIKQMVALQIPSLVPYMVEEVAFDAKAIGSMTNGQSRVMVVITPKETLLQQLDLFNKVQIFPSVATLSSYGILGWAIRVPQTKSAITLILDLNMQEGQACICSPEALLTSRPLRLPDQEFAMLNYNFLLKEIDLTVESYTQEKAGPLPTKIILTGARQPTTELLNVLKNEYNVPIEHIPISYHKEKVFESTIALFGCSLMDIQQGINLIPDQLAQDHLKSKLKSASLSVVWVLCALVVVAGCFFGVDIFRKHQRLDALNAQWAQVKEILESKGKAKQRVEEVMKKTQKRVIAVNILNQITTAAPKGLSLININFDRDRVLSLQGVANNQADINVFQDRLVSSGTFTDARLDFVNKRVTQGGEMSYFKITCQIQ